MSDYISRQKLLDHVLKIGGSPLSEWEPAGVILAIEKQPAADVAPVVRGRWGAGRYNRERCAYEEQCTNCGEWTKDFGKPYCANCGAQMKVDSGNLV
mgnify:CR=1 FL=1